MFDFTTPPGGVGNEIEDQLGMRREPGSAQCPVKYSERLTFPSVLKVQVESQSHVDPAGHLSLGFSLVDQRRREHRVGLPAKQLCELHPLSSGFPVSL